MFCNRISSYLFNKTAGNIGFISNCLCSSNTLNIYHLLLFYLMSTLTRECCREDYLENITLMISIVQGLPLKASKNRTWTKDTNTNPQYKSWNNSALEKKQIKFMSNIFLNYLTLTLSVISIIKQLQILYIKPT